MHQILERAHTAYNKKQYDAAQKLYARIAPLNNKQILYQDQKTALFMLMHISIDKGNFTQALTYHNKLADPTFKANPLPKGVMGFSSEDLISKGILQALQFKSRKEIDLRGFSFTGQSFTTLLTVLRDNVDLASLNLSGNPLTKDEIYQLLDVLTFKPSVNRIGLTHLALDKKAWQLIENLLEQANCVENTELPLLTIELSLSSDISLPAVRQLLKKMNYRSVEIHLKVGAKQHIFKSEALLLKKEKAQKELHQKHLQQNAKTLSQVLDTCLQKNKPHFNDKSNDPKLGEQKHTRNVFNLSSGDEPKNRSTVKPQLKSHTVEIVYNDKGEPCAHINNKNGNLFVSLLQSRTFNLSQIGPLFPCQSLVIYGPTSRVIGDQSLRVTQELQIHCSDLSVDESVTLSCMKATLVCENQIDLAGGIDTTSLTVEGQNIALQPTAQIYSSQNKENENKSTATFKAHHFDIEGGNITHNAVQFSSQRLLVLPPSLQIEAEEVAVSSQANICIQNTLNCDDLSIQCGLEAQICKDAKINATHCRIQGDDILVRGAITGGECYEMYATHQSMLDTSSVVETKKLTVHAKDITTQGSLLAENLHCQSDKIKLGGNIISKALTEKLEQPADEKEIVQTIPLLSLQATACTIDSPIAAEGVFKIQADKLFVTARGRLSEDPHHLLPSPKVPAKQPSTSSSFIQCQDKLYLEKGAYITSPHSLMVKTQDLNLYGTLQSKQTTHVTINGCGEIHDEGKIVGKHVKVEGSKCWNSGEINANDGQLNVAFDKFFINGICDHDLIKKFKERSPFGNLTGKNVTVTSGFFLNLLAMINAQDSIQVAALLDINVGLVNCKNVSRSSLVGINLGINVTVIEQIKGLVRLVRDIADATISSEKELKTVVKEYYDQIDGKTVAMSGVSYALQLAAIAGKILVVFAPQVGIPWTIALNCVNLLLQLAMNGITIKNEIAQLMAKYKSGEMLHARDFYPLILAGKNIAVTGVNAAMVGMNLPNTVSHLPDQIKNSHENLVSTLPSFAGLVGGSCSTQTLINLDGPGVTVTGMSNATSLLHVSALHQNLSSVDFENSLMARQDYCTNLEVMRNISANQYSEQHGNNIALTETLIAKEAALGGHQTMGTLIGNVGHMTQTGTFKADNLSLSIQAGEIDGIVTANGGALQADQLRMGDDANVNLSNMAVKIEHADFSNGQTHLHHVVGEMGQLNVRANAQLELTDKSFLQTGDTDLQGQLSLNDSVMDLTSRINVSATSHVQLENNAVLLGKSLEMGGELTANESAVKADVVIFKNGSHSHLTKTAIEGAVTQEERAELETDDVLMTGPVIELKGTIKVNHRLDLEASDRIILAQGSRLENGSDSEVLLKAPEVERRGELGVDKAILEGQYSSADINNMATDQHIHVRELDIITTEDIILSEAFSSATDVGIYAASIKSTVQQDLHTLQLQSTVGDIKIDALIKTTELTSIYSEGKAYINASLYGSEVDVYGKRGVFSQTPPKPPTHQSYAQSVYERHQQRNSYRPHPHSQQHSIPSYPSVYSPEKIIISGNHVTLLSDADINLKGINVSGNHIGMHAKGKVIFDAGQQNKDLFYGTPFHPAPVVDNHTHIIGTSDVMIKANSLINNGQSVYGGKVFIDVENAVYNLNQGSIAATNFLSIEAKDVFNLCQVNQVHGQYGNYESYQPSFIIGGDGEGIDQGIGLYIHTANKITVDASNIISEGTNYLEADGGFEITARSNTHVTYKEDTSRYFGLSQEHTEVKETVVSRCAMGSTQGQTILISQNGGLKATATDFFGAKGTYIETKRDARYEDIVGSVEITHNSRSGIFHDNQHSYDEFSSTTNIIDQSGITLKGPTITMRGTVIETPGHLHVEANNWKVGVSKLKHTFERDSFGMSATLCNQQFFSWDNPCDFSQPLFCGDPSLNQFNQLAHSNGATEILLNSWATGINVANTTNALLNGIRTNTVISEVLKQEVPGLFAPQLGINWTHTQTSSYSESLGGGHILAGSADFKVQDTIKFKGAPVQVLTDLYVDCKTLVIEGEQLHSTVDQKTQNVNFTISSMGDPYQVGVSASHNQTTTTQQVNGVLQVGGTASLHVKNLVQDGANIDVGHLEGEVGTYKNISRTSETSMESSSYSASTGGNVCVSQQQSNSKILDEASELHVRDSINAKPGEFVVGRYVSTGGKITSEGQNNFTADTIIAKSVEEYQASSGFCINGNVKNFKQETQTNHLLPPDKQSAQITTTNINFNNSHYKAENQSVISGAQGTHVQANHVEGNVVTDSSGGKKVTENSSHSYNVVVPHMTQETKDQFAKNAKWAADNVKRFADRLMQPASEKDHPSNTPNPTSKPPHPVQPVSQDDTGNKDGKGKGEGRGINNNADNPDGKVGKSGPLSSSSQSWEDDVAKNFNSGMGTGSDSSFESWEQEALDYYENSTPVTQGKGRTESATGNEQDNLEYVYQAPKSFVDQSEEYFQGEMYGFFTDYESDVRTPISNVDLAFDESPPPKSKLSSYQNLSKPKDWQSSLARWEREAVDDIDLKPYLAENNDLPIRPDMPRYERPDISSQSARAPIPIYQLSKFKPQGAVFNMLANHKQDPVRVNPAFAHSMKEFGAKLKDYYCTPIAEICKHPKEAMLASFERTKWINPLDPGEAVYELAIDTALNYGLKYVTSDGITKAIMLADLVPLMLTSVGMLRGLSFFENESLGTKQVTTISRASPYDLIPSEPLSKSKREFKKFVLGIKADNHIKETIKYVEVGNIKYVVDGHHRLQAAKILGFESIAIEKVELPYKGYKEVKDLMYYGH